MELCGGRYGAQQSPRGGEREATFNRDMAIGNRSSQRVAESREGEVIEAVEVKVMNVVRQTKAVQIGWSERRFLKRLYLFTAASAATNKAET